MDLLKKKRHLFALNDRHNCYVFCAHYMQA